MQQHICRVQCRVRIAGQLAVRTLGGSHSTALCHFLLRVMTRTPHHTGLQIKQCIAGNHAQRIAWRKGMQKLREDGVKLSTASGICRRKWEVLTEAEPDCSVPSGQCTFMNPSRGQGV